MTRALGIAFSLSLSLALGCVSSRSSLDLGEPTLAPTATGLRAPEFALPFHSARIVDLALLPPQPGERWRLVSGDLDGWIRFWADGRMLAASHAHPGGLAALVEAPDGTVYTAGFDGRVREWPVGGTSPTRTFRFGKQVTALAVSDQRLVISDGRHVQMWSRSAEPQLLWSTQADAFVTGLALSTGGGVIAAAELRESGMRDGIATHPLAHFESVSLRGIDAAEAAELAYLAERDFPGAAADFVEVWQPSQNRSRQLVPQAPIDSDLAIFSPGGVVYREVFSRDRAAAIGRRLEDRAHVSLALVKPWALFSGSTESGATADGEPMINIGDFAIGPSGEIIVVDHFPGWATQPPEWSWRVGERRELAIGHGFAALGDGMGNLAVVDLAQPTELGWQSAGEERPELLAAAAGEPWIATATLEPRTQYRLWSLRDGLHRAIRVEAPSAVISEELAAKSQVEKAPLYPITLVVDAQRRAIVTSLSSFEEPQLGAIRSLSTADGAAQVLSLAATPHPIELGLSPDAAELIAWTPGYPAFAWTGPEWTPREGQSPSGAPELSANGSYAAYVSPLERTLVDRQTGATLVIAKVEQVVSELGDPIPAALSNDGTLALVEPFGGGVVQLLARDGAQAAIELPGAATALAWLDDREGKPVLIVGFEDGSIVRVDRDAGTTQPIHAGTGGRIWALAPLGGWPGVYAELDDEGLALHRLDDDAILELHVADPSTLARSASSGAQALGSVDFVAVWQPGTAMPACVIYDGSRAGVLASPGIRKLGPSEAQAMFDAFASGQACPTQPPISPIEPTPVSD